MRATCDYPIGGGYAATAATRVVEHVYPELVRFHLPDAKATLTLDLADLDRLRAAILAKRPVAPCDDPGAEMHGAALGGEG